MKYINKSTGVILEPKSEMVIEQLEKSADYAVFEEVQSEQVDPGEKPISKMNKDELIAYASNAGIQVPEGANKAEIIELIKAVVNE